MLGGAIESGLTNSAARGIFRSGRTVSGSEADGLADREPQVHHVLRAPPDPVPDCRRTGDRGAEPGAEPQRACQDGLRAPQLDHPEGRLPGRSLHAHAGTCPALWPTSATGCLPRWPTTPKCCCPACTGWTRGYRWTSACRPTPTSGALRSPISTRWNQATSWSSSGDTSRSHSY